jgi:hypothetical protein
MPVVDGSEAARLLRWAVDDPETVRRYRAKVVSVPGSACAWWSAALSGRGHGRLWLGTVAGRDLVVIAHRFGFALEHGVDALLATPVLGHGCDNPLCQRIDAAHVRASSHVLNRREWAARRRIGGSPLLDRRGARGRARALRDAVHAAGELLDVAERVTVLGEEAEAARGAGPGRRTLRRGTGKRRTTVAVPARPDRACLWPVAPTAPPSGRVTRGVAGCARHLRRAGMRSVGRAGAPRTAGLGGAQPPSRRRGARSADRAGTADRPACGAGAFEPRDRTRASRSAR